MMDAEKINLREGKGEIRRSMLQGIAWTSVDRWGNRLLSLATVVVLARLLDRTDFGLVATAAICVDYFSTFVGQGLGLALIQRKDLEPGHLNAAFWISMVFAVSLIMFTWAAAPYLARFLDNPAASPVLRWLSLGLVLHSLSRIHVALLTKQMRFASIALVNVTASVIGAASGLTMAFLGFGVWSLVAQHLIGGVAARIVLCWVTHWNPGLRFGWRHVRDLYGYSLYVFVDQQVLFIARRLDEALVAAFMGVAELGLYSIAKRIVLLLQEAWETPLGQIFFPAFSRLQTSKAELVNETEMSYRMACVFIVPMSVGIIALAPEAVSLLFGPKLEDASPFVRALAVGSPFLIFPLTTHAVFHALGRPGIPLALNTGRAALGAILLPFGAIFGSIGIPAAFSFRNIISGVVDIMVFRKMITASSNQFVSALYRPAFAAFVMAFLVRLVVNWLNPLGMLFGVAVAIFTGVVAYFFLMFLIDRRLVEKCFGIIRKDSFSGIFRLNPFGKF